MGPAFLQGGEGQREGDKTMKSWIKYGLAGALILVASFWGGSVRAAGRAHSGARARLSPSFPISGQ